MHIDSLSFGNYNPKTLVNNPPDITNYPFWEYLTENKMNFKHAKLDTFKSIHMREESRDKFMTWLFTSTMAGIILGLILFRNKAMQLYSITKEFVKKIFSKKAG